MDIARKLRMARNVTFEGTSMCSKCVPLNNILKIIFMSKSEFFYFNDVYFNIHRSVD